MSATYLVDGYNLIHAMGLLPPRVGPGGLEKARRALLGLLAGTFGEEASAVTVVFDARQAPPGADAAQIAHGIRVQFAVGGREADEVIEELIQQASAPKSLSVVSDDHRLQQAARRRQARSVGCGDFLDLLKAKRKECRRPAPDEKHGHASGAETAHWLEAFGDLEADPHFRELFDRFGL